MISRLNSGAYVLRRKASPCCTVEAPSAHLLHGL
jgi:hypothetical protein